MANAGAYRASLQFMAALWILASLPSDAQTKKEIRFSVAPKPVISITNNYGTISVKAFGNDQVIVTTVAYSNDVSFLNEQHGNRIELRAECNRAGTGLAEYTVLVPAESTVTLQSLDGALYAQGLRGDAILEGSTSIAEVSDSTDAHIHIKTLSGAASLKNIRHSRLYVNSIAGNINVHNVTESLIEAHAGTGRISYDGDPGDSGEYKLTSQSGDLDVSIPADAIVRIDAHSFAGGTNQSATSDTTQRVGNESRFMKPDPIRGGSRFVLRSFRGKIHVKRP
jgi:Putative adhesin